MHLRRHHTLSRSAFIQVVCFWWEDPGAMALPEDVGVCKYDCLHLRSISSDTDGVPADCHAYTQQYACIALDPFNQNRQEVASNSNVTTAEHHAS